MQRDVSASFQIVSQECSGKDLASLLEVPDVEIHTKGERISGRSETHYYQQSILRLTSRLSGAASVDEHINDLLDRLGPEANKVPSLPSHCVAELWVKASFEPSQFGFEIRSSTMARLAALGIELIFGIYCDG